MLKRGLIGRYYRASASSSIEAQAAELFIRDGGEKTVVGRRGHFDFKGTSSSSSSALQGKRRVGKTVSSGCHGRVYVLICKRVPMCVCISAGGWL